MAAPSIFLSINGAAPVAAEELGWVVETLSKRNLAADVLTLRRVHRGAQILTVDTTVSVLVDGLRVFTGTAQAPQISMTQGDSTVTQQVFGPWWTLQQTTYTRAMPRLVSGSITWDPPALGYTYTIQPGDGFQVWDPDINDWVPPTVGTTYKFARATNLSATPKEIDLMQYLCCRGFICDPNWLASPIYRTLQKETRALIAYVLSTRAGLGLDPTFSCDLDALEAGLGASASPKYRTFQDQRVATILSQLAAVKPDAVLYWDYSAATPALLSALGGTATAVDLTPGADLRWSLQAQPRPDLRPAGVIIRWDDPTELGWEFRGFKLAAWLDRYPANIQAIDPGVTTFSLDYVADVATFKPALAQSLYEAMSTLRATGSLSFADLTPAQAAAMRPGLAYQVPGDEVLADCQLLVQETTWTLATGRVQCSLGYPRTLDLQTINDLKGWLTMSFNGGVFSYQALVPPPH